MSAVNAPDSVHDSTLVNWGNVHANLELFSKTLVAFVVLILCSFLATKFPI